MDNAPEFIAQALAEWAKSRGIALNHIQPGGPTQNAYVKRFNKTYRTEVLDCYVFESLQEVRQMTTTGCTDTTTTAPTNHWAAYRWSSTV